MKGLFIPGITAKMFRNGCLEGIEALMAEGTLYDIDHPTESEVHKSGIWNDDCTCSACGTYSSLNLSKAKYCPECGAKMKKEQSND